MGNQSVKIRHAMATWTATGAPSTTTSFRGDVVSMPDAEVSRLQPQGAIVPGTAALDVPGTILTLGAAPSDAQLVDWVMGASLTDIATLVRSRPDLAARLGTAGTALTDQLQTKLDVLSNLNESLTDVGAGGVTDGTIYFLLEEGVVPAFTASTPPGGTRTVPYTYTYTASGEPAPTFAVKSGTLPTGLTLDANTGVLSGTPSVANTFAFTVTAKNNVSSVDVACSVIIAA